MLRNYDRLVTGRPSYTKDWSIAMATTKKSDMRIEHCRPAERRQLAMFEQRQLWGIRHQLVRVSRVTKL